MCCTRLAGNAGPKNLPSGHHHTNFAGYIFATKACIDNWKKTLVKRQYLPHVSSQYGEFRPTNSWDPFGSLGHPSKFQLFSRLGSVTAQHSSSGASAKLCGIERRAPPIFAGRPSRWALAHILVVHSFIHFADASDRSMRFLVFRLVSYIWCVMTFNNGSLCRAQHEDYHFSGFCL